MGLPRYLRFAALLSLFAVLSPPSASADCPTGSGIEFPFLTPNQLACQRVSFNATVDYFYSFISARQDCFSKELFEQVPPNSLDCLFPITNDQPGTTGDDDTDRRLRVAESQMTTAILSACTNVDLAKLLLEELAVLGGLDGPNGAAQDLDAPALKTAVPGQLQTAV